MKWIKKKILIMQGSLVGFMGLVGTTLLWPSTAHANWFSDGVVSGISSIIVVILNLFYRVSYWFMLKMGDLLDEVVVTMVLEMSDRVKDISNIDLVWTVFRDLANLLFIFVIIYAAIRIILGLGSSQMKQMLGTLIVVAVLVNFSLFFTKVVIDVSNVLALEIYESMSVSIEEDGESLDDGGDGNGADISLIFGGATKIASIDDFEPLDESATGGSADSAEASNFNIITNRIMAILFLLVTGFVMGAAAFLLILRFGMLLVLMILSPLAFVAYILPDTKQHFKRWWSELVSHAFFAPAYFIMLYAVAIIITSGAFQAAVAGESTSLGEAMKSEAGVSMGIVINYALVIILMVAALVLAKQMGVAGGKKAVSWGQSARKWGQTKVVAGTAGSAAGAAAWTGRQTAGRGAQKLSESRRLKNWAEQSKLGRMTLKAADKTSQKSFDARATKAGSQIGGVGQREGGFRGTIEQKDKKKAEDKERIERLSPHEKAAAEHAKLEKERTDKQLKDVNEGIDRQEKKADGELKQLKESYKDANKKVGDELSKVGQAIKEREGLLDQLAKAEGEGNADLEKRLKERLDHLTDNIATVDDHHDLEDRRDTLKTRQEKVQASYNKRKRGVEDRKEDLRNRREVARDAHKERHKELDEVVNVGKERGEAFVEAMLTQRSVLDKINDGIHNLAPADRALGDADETTTTRSNRSFALDKIGSIKDKERRERMSRTLEDMG